MGASVTVFIYIGQMHTKPLNSISVGYTYVSLKMRSFSIRYLWIEIRTQSDTSFCTLLEVHFVIQKYYFHHLNFIQSFRPSLLSKVDLRTPKEEGFLKSLYSV